VLILVFRLNQTSDFSDGITAVGEAFDRTNLLAQINYDTDKLYILAAGWVANTVVTSTGLTPEASLRSDVKEVLNDFLLNHPQ